MNLYKDIKYNYVSFDIFDTLLYRDVSKDEIFNIIEKKLNYINPQIFNNYKEKRINAQKEVQASKKIEADIYDIYKHIKLDKKSTKVAIEKEIETEIEHLHPNLILTDRLKQLKKEGKKIIISSDMYLTVDNIKYILKYFNIPYDYLFVSSDLQARKSNGKLFTYEMKKININPNEMIHIGDDLKSDVLIPTLLGIKSIYWKEDISHFKALKKKNTEETRVLLDIFYKNNCSSYFETIGFNMLGPVLYSYCNWLNDKIRDKKLDRLVFLSRDGLIIKKAYDKLYKNNYEYFFVSRRTITVPLLIYANNMKDVLSIVPYIKRKEAIEDFLIKIGIEDKEMERYLIKAFGKEISRNKLLSNEGEKIYNIISPKMKANAYKEMEAAEKYITSNIQYGKNGLVDIGWFGTTQKALNKICNEISNEYDFYGLYLGVIKKNNNNLNNASGFIYDHNESNEIDSDFIDGFNGLIELMFTADHGSAKKYYMENDIAMCELERKQEYSDFTKEVQKGALKFIDYVIENEINLPIDNKISYILLEDLLKNPTLNECYMLGKLKFYDAYLEEIIQFKGWKNILFHPKNSINLFLKSNWKIGYLKEMFPYFNTKTLYKFLKIIK